MHAFVIGELAMGYLKNRKRVLQLLTEVPRLELADEDDFLEFVSGESIFGIGIGYVDAHLLRAVQLTPGVTFWTYDKRLHELANKLGCAATGLRLN